MRYTAPVQSELPPVFLNTFSYASVWRTGWIAAPSSLAWSTTNRIIYIPFFLTVGQTVYRYFWLNGATVGTNNFQVGVYTEAFAAVNRGTSTLSAGTANRVQFDDITDYYLGPGSYYLAMWGSGTTATIFSRNTGLTGGPLGVYYQTNAGGLPTTGTPADTAATDTPVIPLFGMAFRATDP